MIQPINNYLTVEIEMMEKSKGGILLSATAKPTNVGRVISLSEEITTIKVGDRVVFDRYRPLEIEVYDTKISLVLFEDIYAVIK